MMAADISSWGQMSFNDDLWQINCIAVYTHTHMHIHSNTHTHDHAQNDS